MRTFAINIHRQRVFVVSFAHYIHEKYIIYIMQKLNDQVAATLRGLFLIAFKNTKKSIVFLHLFKISPLLFIVLRISE